MFHALGWRSPSGHETRSRPAAPRGKALPASNEQGVVSRGRASADTRPQASICVTVPEHEAEPLRCALFDRLYRHIVRIVVAPGKELGSRDAQAELELVIARDHLDEALHVVMSTASVAHFGPVQRR